MYRDDVPTEFRTQHAHDLFKLCTGKHFGKMNGQSEGVQVPDFKPTIGVSESVGLTRCGTLKKTELLGFKLVGLIKISLGCLQLKKYSATQGDSQAVSGYILQTFYNKTHRYNSQPRYIKNKSVNH